jgi:protein SCO1/2
MRALLRRPLALALAGAALALVVVLALVLVPSLPFVARAKALNGTDLGGTPAPGFQLTDQSGQPVSLASLRGKVVVLTFLYTNCPDVCPLIAGKFGIAHDQLGAQAGDVAFVAVTVDPKRDTIPQIRQFLDRRGLTDKMLYLTGYPNDLQQVWQNYGVAAITQPGTPSATADYLVDHSTGIYVIDKSGRERTFLGSDFAPADLVQDVKTLLSE